MCLQNTLGGDHGNGHFYLAETRTFLLCVDREIISATVLYEVRRFDLRSDGSAKATKPPEIE
jgi:hypothetical protein